MLSSIFTFNCFSDDAAGSATTDAEIKDVGKASSAGRADEEDDTTASTGSSGDEEENGEENEEEEGGEGEGEDEEDGEEDKDEEGGDADVPPSSSEASEADDITPSGPLDEAEREEVISSLQTNKTPEGIVRAMNIAARASDLDVGLAACDVILGALSPTDVLRDLGSAGVCRATIRLIEAHEGNKEVFDKGIKILAQLGKEPSNIALFDIKSTAKCLSKCISVFPDPDSLLSVASVVEVLLQGDTLNHSSMAAALLDQDIFAQLTDLIDNQDQYLSRDRLVNTVCRILIELCPVRPTGIYHDSIDLAHTFAVLQDVQDRICLTHDSEKAASSFSDVAAAKEHFKWACRNYGVSLEGILSEPGADGQVVRKKRHISKQNLLKMLEIMLHVTDSSAVGAATRILTLQQEAQSAGDAKVSLNNKKSKSKSPNGPGSNTFTSSSSSLSPAASRRFHGDSKTTQSYQAYCKALQAAVTFISDEDDGSSTSPRRAAPNSKIPPPPPPDPTDLSTTVSVAAYFAQPTEPTSPLPLPEGLVIGVRPKGFAHRSRRFDVDTPLRYDSSNEHKLPPRAAAFKKSCPADRSSGPLYNADLQFSMALAKCGPHYEPKRSDGSKDTQAVEFTLQDAERCIERLALTVSLDPINKKALFYLGMLLSEFYDNRTSDDAENFFKDVLALDPLFPKVYYNLGHIYFQRGDYASALDCFKSAVMVNPLDLDARVYKAICLGRLGGVQNTADAMGEYKFVLDTDGNCYLALYNFGVLLVALNDVSGALFYFQRLVMVDPESVEGLLVTARAYCLRYLQTIQRSADQMSTAVHFTTLNISGSSDSNESTDEGDNKSIDASTVDSSTSRGERSVTSSGSKTASPADAKILLQAIDDLKRALRCYQQLVNLGDVQPMTDIYECIVQDVATIASDLTNQLARLAEAKK